MKKTTVISEGEELRRELTRKEAAFLKEYIENGGNGTLAALKAYDTTDYHTAGAIASQNLKKLKNPIALFMDRRGLTLGKLVDVLEQGLDATTPIHASIMVSKDGKLIKAEDEGVIEVPDHAVRHKFLQTAAKWLKVENVEEESKDGSSYNQFNFYGTENNGRKSVIEEAAISGYSEEELSTALVPGTNTLP